jgi:hypothetical protein
MKRLIFLGLIIATSAAAESKIKLLVALTPAGSFEAVSEKLKGNLIQKNGELTADKLWVSIESFKTGIDLRDEHFWRHMRSNVHTKAVITDVKGKAGKATGTLEINGVKKTISMNYKEKEGDIFTTFMVKASDFNLPKVEYLGIGVSNDIKIEAIYPYVKK